MPYFSVIMPCYNAQATLLSAVETLWSQTVSDWELICINDGSQDQTPNLLDALAEEDPRIKVHHITNRGPSVARNVGAAIATGDVLSFLDADDLWEPEKLAQLSAVFADPKIGGAFGEVSFFDTPECEVTRSKVPSRSLTIPHLMGENPVCTMSNFSLRKQAFLNHGGLAQGFVHNEDLEWLIRLVGMGVRIEPIAKRQVWYRKSDEGLSADLEAMARSRQQALRTAKYFGFAPTAAQNAVYLRYLARRALRLEKNATAAMSFAARGLAENPLAFLSPPHRGVATALAALAAPILPNALRRNLFS